MSALKLAVLITIAVCLLSYGILGWAENNLNIIIPAGFALGAAAALAFFIPLDQGWVHLDRQSVDQGARPTESE